MYTENQLMPEKRFLPIAEHEKRMGDSVTDELRRAIILRTLKLGERLVERKIAAELNVSITPLRQAFQVLANEGLIVVYPYRGSYVANITKEFIEDVSFCRKMVEIAAAEKAYDHMVASDPDCLLRILKESIAGYKKTGRIYDIIRQDILFHQTIINHAGKKTLLDFWKMISPRLMLLLSYAKHDSFSIDQFHERHIHIARALADKAGRKAFVNCLKAKFEIAYSPEEEAIMLAESARHTAGEPQSG